MKSLPTPGNELGKAETREKTSSRDENRESCNLNAALLLLLETEETRGKARENFPMSLAVHGSVFFSILDFPA